MHAYDFLNVSLNNYRSLRLNNFDLYYPIIYFIGGNEAEYLEEQFSLFFFALEKIHNLYSIKKGYDKILSDSDFASLKNELLKIINESVTDQEKLNWIEQKLRELNRPPIKEIVLKKMFSDYGVEWKDLYPEGADLNIFKVRNELFHTAKFFDIEILDNATQRIKYIVARLIIKILGWNGRSNIPSKSIGNFLKNESK